MTNRVLPRKMLAAGICLALPWTAIAPSLVLAQTQPLSVAPAAPLGAEAASALSAGQGGAGPAGLSPGAWANYFQEHPSLSGFLADSLRYAPAQAALGRLLSRTGLRPERLHEPPFISLQRDMISEAIRPAVQEALSGLAQANSSPQAAAGATAKLAALAATFRDLHTVSGLVSSNRDAVIIGHHLIELRLLQAEEAKIADSVEKVRKDWSSSEPEDGVDAPAEKEGSVVSPASREVARRLSADFDLALRKPCAPRQQLSNLLVTHAGTLAALESGDAPEAHAHILKVVQEHGLANLDSWLWFCEKGKEALWLAAGSMLPLLDVVAPGVLRANERERALWYMSDPPENLRVMLRKPEPAYLELLFVIGAFRQGEAAAGWPAVEALLYKGLRAAGSRDNLRDALNLLYAKAFGKQIPEPLWAAFLRQPPESKEEREALGAVSGMLINSLNMTPELGGILRGHVPEGTSGRLDYAGLKRDFMRQLRKDLNKTLGLSEKARVRLAEDAKFIDAMNRNGLINNILSLSSFSNWLGRRLLRRLLEELSDSPVENGRIRYERRYEKLKGKVPDGVLARWMEDYDEGLSSGANEDAGPAADGDLSSYYQRLLAGLGLSWFEDLGGLSPKIQDLAARLDKELPPSAEKGPLLAALRTEFLPRLQELLEALRDNRAPSRDSLKALMPLLGKRHWMKGALADPEAAFSAVKSLLASGSAPPPRYVFHATDDPAMMIRMGNEPIKTCQKCTEAGDHNTSGQPVSRLLLGQIRLGYWLRKNALAARAVLEIGKDDEGNPALFVERVYYGSDNGLDWERMKQSVLKYARYLGVSSIYIDEKDSQKGWLDGTKQKYKFFDRSPIFLPLYRDGFKKRKAPGARLFGAARARPSFLRRLLARIFDRPKPHLSYDADGRLGIEWDKRFLAIGDLVVQDNYSLAFKLQTPPDQRGWIGWIFDSGFDHPLAARIRFLRWLDRRKFPHARLIAYGNGILIREKANGPTLSELWAKGPLSPPQKASFIDLVYKGLKHDLLIRVDKLIWNGEKFVVDYLTSVHGVRAAQLSRLYSLDTLTLSVMSKPEFWSLLKMRSGPESKLWRKISEGLPEGLRDGTAMALWERGHHDIEEVDLVRAARADEESGHGR